MRVPVILAGQEPVVRAMVVPDPLPDGWAFDRARIDEAEILAWYHDGGGELLLRFLHPSADGEVRTERFVLDASRDDEAARALVAAVADSARRHEGDFVWNEIEPEPTVEPPPIVEDPVERRRVDVEWKAFAAGVKPAIRLTIPPAEAGDVVRRYREYGAAVVTLEGRIFHSKQTTFVYVAHSVAEAEAMRDIEVRVLDRSPDREALTRELGKRLGYPECCTRAFSIRIRRPKPSKGPPRSRPRGVDPWKAAREAWVRRPNPRLNHLLQHERQSLVSFEPCRYDCPEALAVADRIADAVREADAEWLDYLERELARPIAIAPDGAHAFVEIEGGLLSRRIVAASAPVDAEGHARDSDVELASRLLGRRLRRHGRVAGLGGKSPVVLLDFGG